MGGDRHFLLSKPARFDISFIREIFGLYDGISM